MTVEQHVQIAEMLGRDVRWILGMEPRGAKQGPATASSAELSAIAAAHHALLAQKCRHQGAAGGRAGAGQLMRVEHLGDHAQQAWRRLRDLYVEEVQMATGRGRRAAMLMGKKSTELLGTAAGADAPTIAADAWLHALRAQVLADCMELYRAGR